MASLNTPIIHSDSGFIKYLQEIKSIPSLPLEEEFMLAKRLVEHQDIEAAHRLVTSHLKLVAKVAFSFRGYGLPLIELVAEGNIGLMQAVKRFKPDLGFRLSTYAIWWIKAAIQEYILKSWSMVKIGTTSAQKKLFFNLGKVRRKIKDTLSRDINHLDYDFIAGELNVTAKEVKDMNSRMVMSDISLNQRVDHESPNEIIDLLPETRPNQEYLLGESEEFKQKKSIFLVALDKLTERERDIIQQRRLQEEPSTLDDLSKFYNISRERVRQIENRAFEKLQEFALKMRGEKNA